MTPERLAELRRLRDDPDADPVWCIEQAVENFEDLLDHIDKLEKRINAMDAGK